MPIPTCKYDPVHLTGGGANAPNCEIRVSLLCVAGDCTAPAYTVEVVETATSVVLASGPVRCTGAYEPHVLTMVVKRSLQAVRVTLRYTCGQRVETDQFPSMIWIVCS